MTFVKFKKFVFAKNHPKRISHPSTFRAKSEIRVRPNHPQWILRQTRLLSAWELFLEKPAVDCQTYDDGYQNSYTVGHKVPPVT